MRYVVGDFAWLASFDSEEVWITCPDCAGTKHLRVLLPDDTMLTIDCEGCKRGYEGPWGRLQVYNRTHCAKRVRITGFEVSGTETRYQTSDHYRVDEGFLFDTEADALVAAETIANKADLEERERINQKEKPTKSWAWNVHYHRRCIRDAEKQIAYHSGKLAVARTKTKEAAE